MTRSNQVVRILFLLLFPLTLVTLASAQTASLIGKEIYVPLHLQDGQEFHQSIPDLIARGKELFQANWTSQEGQGRPFNKGTGSPLSDPASPLVFPRNFDRLSGEEAAVSRLAFQALSPSQQDDVIEFLKSLQVLPPGTPCHMVDDRFECLNGDDNTPDHR